MNRNRIIYLAVTALVVVLGAVVYLAQRDAAVSDAAVGEPFVRDLEARANDVAQVEIIRGGTTTTIARTGDAWRVREKAGFGADFNVVKDVVLSIARLKRVEAKTTKAEQYAKIGVEDPAGAQAQSVGVRLKDASGAPLAAVVIGASRDSDDGVRKLMYVRGMDEPQAWLVEGEVKVPGDAADWLQKTKVIDVFRSRIKSFTVALPEGDRYMIVRDAPDAKGFRYVPPPRNAVIRSQARLDDMSAALEHVVPDDVYPASVVAFDPAQSLTNEYRTFDGLVVKASAMQKDERWYAKYAVSADAKSADDKVKQEAANLARSLDEKVFVLPEAKAALMNKKNADVLAPQ
jgi:hypothetical protein